MFIGASHTLTGAIVNGGFEDVGNFVSDWSPTQINDPIPPNLPISQVYVIDPTNPYGISANGGSMAVAFTSDPSAPASSTVSSMASISQLLTTNSTKLYNLEFFVANPYQDVNAKQNLFSVTWNGAPVPLSLWNANFAIPPVSPGDTELSGPPGTYVIQPNSPWFRVLIQDLVPGSGSQTNLVISGQNNNFVTLVDDVTVTETPEASTVVLLIAGAALIGTRRRRQQAVS